MNLVVNNQVQFYVIFKLQEKVLQQSRSPFVSLLPFNAFSLISFKLFIHLLIFFKKKFNLKSVSYFSNFAKSHQRVLSRFMQDLEYFLNSKDCISFKVFVKLTLMRLLKMVIIHHFTFSHCYFNFLFLLKINLIKMQAYVLYSFYHLPSISQFSHSSCPLL